MIVVLHAHNSHARSQYAREMPYLVSLACEEKIDQFFATMSCVSAAIVNTDDLNVAFQKTNHIDYDWWKNEGVIDLGTSKRSTSVGDTMITRDHVYIVEKYGFKQIKLNKDTE